MSRLTTICFLAILLPLTLCNALARAWPRAAASSAYRDFALNNSGDSAAGKLLFDRDEKLTCTACHRVTGKEKSGPNLDGIGDNLLARAIDSSYLGAQPVNHAWLRAGHRRDQPGECPDGTARAINEA